MAEDDATFGAFRYHWKSETLYRGEWPVALGRRATMLLARLLTRRGEIVSKADLMTAGWPDVAVEESNLTVQMAALRTALKTAPDDPEWIVTVPRVGYRFIDLFVERHENRRPPADEELSVAVLPFANMSSDPEQAFFADGIAEDLITDLSKVHGLLVIARNSSFAFRDRSADRRGLADELGVRYLVEGSVRRAAGRVRISAQLVDARSSRQLWAERFDSDLADIFAIQDQVAGQIVSALSEILPLVRPLPRQRAVNLEAHELFVQARPLVTRTPEGNRIAQPLLLQAIELDPTFAEARAWLAISYQFGHFYWGQESRDPEALALATQAVALDPGNPDSLMAVAYLKAYAGELAAGLAGFEAAVALSPNHADAWCLFADLKVLDSRPLEAIDCARRAFRLNPRPPSQYFWLLGWSQYAAGRYEDAVTTLSNPTARDTGCQRILAAALAQLGRQDEAAHAARRFLAVFPHFSAAEWAQGQPFRVPADLQHFVDGYLKAGLPG